MIETSPRFLACLPYTLDQEGGYSNDAHDPGGMTMKGIIQREYDAYRRRNGLPTQWVKKISDDEVQDIYFHSYWLPHCPDLPAGLDLSFFDNAVNEGPHAAVALLQRALGVADDGIWGPQTEGALPKAPDVVKAMIIAYASKRAGYYRSLRNFPFFGQDWLRRTKEIKAQSLAMVTA